MVRNPYLASLTKKNSPYLTVAMKGGLNHEVPGMFRVDLARLAVKQAVEEDKACARNIMHFNKEVIKETRLVENAAHILMSMKAKSKSKAKAKAKKSRTIKPLIGKITQKNGVYSYSI